MSVTDPKPQAIFAGHALGINGVLYSFDSRTILSCGNDGLVCQWDLNGIDKIIKEINAPTVVMRGHKNGVRAASWSPREVSLSTNQTQNPKSGTRNPTKHE